MTIDAYRKSLRMLHKMKGVSAFKATRAERLEGRTASLDELDGIQDRRAPDLVTDYPEDGCYARAQVLCKDLREKGISHGKLFVHSTYKDLGSDDVRWNYHVAAIALAQDGAGQAEPVVLDPVLSDDPLKPDDWLESFHRGGHVIATLHSDRKYFNGIGGGSNFEKNTQRALRRLAELEQSLG